MFSFGFKVLIKVDVIDRQPNCIGSSVVHPPYIGLAEHGRKGGDPCVLISSLVDAPYDVF